MMWLVVFFAMIVVDIIWAEWAKACAAKQAGYAATLSAGIVLCGTFVTAEAVHDLWLLIPACAGGWIGTYWSVIRGKT